MLAFLQRPVCTATLTGTRSNSAPAGAEASGPSAGSAASGSAGVGRAGLDAAAVAGDAHASVLAQHELNKVRALCARHIRAWAVFVLVDACTVLVRSRAGAHAAKG
jgi:hypothetical protein